MDPGELNHVLQRLVTLEVRSMTSSPPTLEELFLRHYGDVVGGPPPDRRTGARAMSGFTGTARLTRLALRRDRVTLPAWLLGMTVFLAATTAMFVHSLATPADAAQEAALSTNNPGMRMLGLTSGPSVGGCHDGTATTSRWRCWPR